MEEALRLSGAKTKKDAVRLALEELVAGRKRRDLKEIRGKIEFAAGYDYKKLRRR
jgi:Arc/MetJ family transcription regulator